MRNRKSAGGGSTGRKERREGLVGKTDSEMQSPNTAVFFFFLSLRLSFFLSTRTHEARWKKLAKDRVCRAYIDRDTVKQAKRKVRTTHKTPCLRIEQERW